MPSPVSTAVPALDAFDRLALLRGLKIVLSARTGSGPASQARDVGCVFGQESVRHRSGRLCAATDYDLLTSTVVGR
ncbi:hypothetical protein ACQPZQ_38665 [Pseudonocardia sp. CA-142604]|uniref:hypothetical protein n=1 Tax=Pseudonocardia sp. CA-142604 TaxID=3240024 RepID=UPI003D8B9A2D